MILAARWNITWLIILNSVYLILFGESLLERELPSIHLSDTNRTGISVSYFRPSL